MNKKVASYETLVAVYIYIHTIVFNKGKNTFIFGEQKNIKYKMKDYYNSLSFLRIAG